MKKNDWILIIATLFYSFLFYKEAAGINFFIFSSALIALILIRDQSLVRSSKWLIIASGTVISGAAVALYGNWLSIWANLISLALLAGISISARSSVIMALFHSVYSAGSSIVFMILDAIERKPASSPSQRSPFYVRLLLILVPLLITLLFFFLYRGSNPVFNNFAKNIRLDFITWGWIFFTLLGFILLYGFFYHRRIKELAAWDENAPVQLLPRVVEEGGAGLFSIRNQYLSGMLLFLMLNFLLLLVNALDLQYVYISKTLPPGLTHSENVHQGVELLILSIIIAIAIILFVFRGDMNFYPKNKALRILAYAWILQNMFMVVSTIMRNNMYVGDHGLTYKRIGVYVYLALALIGLVVTWIKIMKIKSNWYLFRANTGTWYGMLVIASLVNWDKIIVNYNMTNASSLQSVDKDYLIDLAPATLAEMLSYNDSTPYLKKEYAQPSFDGFSLIPDMDRSYGEGTLESKLHGKLYLFFREREKLGWQSWNLEDSRTMNEIVKLSNEGKLDHLSLGMFGIRSLQPLNPVSSNVTSLDLASNQLGKNLEDLSLFRNIEKLNLSSNALDSLDEFPVLPRLRELDLSLNQQLRIPGALRNVPALSKLNLSSCTYIDLRGLPVFNELTDLDVSGNTVSGISQLVKYKKLGRLSLRNVSLSYNNSDEFPFLPSLRSLDLANDYNTGNYTSQAPAMETKSPPVLLKGAVKCINLEELDLSGNDLLTIRMIADPASGTGLVKLRTLSVQNNRISDLSGIEKLAELTSLNISYNQLGSLAPLASLKELKTLYASYNPIKNMDAFKELTQLEHLEVANVENIMPAQLSTLIHLRWLNISGTRLNSLEMLREMKDMENLYLQNNLVESIGELQGLAKLKVLNISGNRVQDYSPLYKLKQLRELYIDPVPQSTMDALKKALPATRITVIGNMTR